MTWLITSCQSPTCSRMLHTLLNVRASAPGRLFPHGARRSLRLHPAGVAMTDENKFPWTPDPAHPSAGATQKPDAAVYWPASLLPRLKNCAKQRLSALPARRLDGIMAELGRRSLLLKTAAASWRLPCPATPIPPPLNFLGTCAVAGWSSVL